MKASIKSAFKTRLAKKILIGGFWNLFSAGITKISSLLLFMWIARSIGKHEFGMYSILQSTVFVLTIFAEAGMGVACTKLVAEMREKSDKRVGAIISLARLSNLWLGLLLYVVIWFISPFLAVSWFDNIDLIPLLRISGVILPLMAISSSQIGVLAGFARYKCIAKVGFYSSLISFPVSAILVAKFGLIGATYGFVFSQLLTTIIGFFYTKKTLLEFDIEIVPGSWKSEIQILKKFGIPALISSIFIAPVNWVASSFLAIQNQGYAEVGLFNAANQWRNLVLFIPTAVSAVMLSTLSELYGRKDFDRHRRLIRLSILLNLTVGLLMLIPVTIFPLIFLRGYGDSFNDGANVLIVMVASGVVISVNSMFSRSVISQGKVWQSFTFDMVWAATYLIMSYILIPQYKALGLAFSSVIAGCVQLVFQIFISKNSFWGRGV